MDLRQRIADSNQHWQGLLPHVEPVQRDLYRRLWSDRTVHLMSLIIGPRRTGKSVLLKQLLVNLLHTDHVAATQILFFEFTDTDSPETIQRLWEYFTGEIAQTNQPIYCFFDEIQFVNAYESTVKLLYDQHPRAKLFLTGSLSLTYKRRMSESLAGRFLPYDLYPLRFPEYLRLSSSPLAAQYEQAMSETKPLLKQMSVKALNPAFRAFLFTGRLPESALLADPTAQSSYLETVLSQSLSQDAFAYFHIEKPRVLHAMFGYIRQNPGAVINIDRLSGVSGSSRETVAKYLDVLEIMRLMYPVYNSTSALAKFNATRKAYPSSHFITGKYDPATTTGFAVESYVLERLVEQGKHVTFYRSRNQEIDFLIPDEKIALEVKFRTDPGNLQPVVKLSRKLGFAPHVITLDKLEIAGVSSTPACLF